MTRKKIKTVPEFFVSFRPVLFNVTDRKNTVYLYA